MKVSQLGLGSTRLKNVDKQFPAQDILLQSGQIVQYGTGNYAYNNVPLLTKRNVEEIMRKVLKKYGCTEVQLPTLQPESIWRESQRWDTYVSDGTMLTVDTSKGRYCLAPTAEETMLDFARSHIKSHKNLPAILYQIGEKYRNELRARGVLLRGKSFPMMDAYSFNKDQDDLIESYNIMRKAYFDIFKELGLDVIPVAADNGAIGGKRSEEFMVLSDIGEDTILYDKETGKAFNTEILERDDATEYLKEYGINDADNLEPKKSVELGHIFQIGTRYADNMKANYMDDNGKQQPYYMGCYGIGVSRTLATIYEKNLLRDKNGKPVGISLPVNIAPYLLQIVPKSNDPVKVAEAQALYEVLGDYDVETLIDDRDGITMGSKLKDCKILGTPYIAVLGDRTRKGEIEIENSKTGEHMVVKQSDLAQAVINLEKDRKQNANAKLEDYVSQDKEVSKDDEDIER